jgi:hypothetical protein
MVRDTSLGMLQLTAVVERTSHQRKDTVLSLLSFLKGKTHSASYPMGTGALFLGVKRPGREADHSPPSSAEVKNGWSYTSTPPIRLHGVVLN